MKKTLIVVVLAAAVIAGLISAYLEMREERDLEATGEAPVAAPSRVERGTDGTTVLKLDAETQNRLGLQTSVPVPGSVTAELLATARVLDGAALAEFLNAIRSAQAALDTARADHERKKKLFDNGQNASASSVEQAAGLVIHHTIAAEAARDRLAAAWGMVVAGREDLPALARLLLQREAALVRVDLLPADRLAASPQTFRLFWQSGDAIAAASVLGPSPAADSTVAGQGYLCLVTNNTAQLIPGSRMLARLENGASEKGTVIPRSAVVRHAGLGWAYAQTGAEMFARRAVPLDRPHPDGWLVKGEGNLPVVISGAQSLLSEELKGSIQMKD